MSTHACTVTVLSVTKETGPTINFVPTPCRNPGVNNKLCFGLIDLAISDPDRPTLIPCLQCIYVP
jgi:hypothetical protein